LRNAKTARTNRNSDRSNPTLRNSLAVDKFLFRPFSERTQRHLLAVNCFRRVQTDAPWESVDDNHAGFATTREFLIDIGKLYQLRRTWETITQVYPVWSQIT
jgi:hypothetical protein